MVIFLAGAWTQIPFSKPSIFLNLSIYGIYLACCAFCRRLENNGVLRRIVRQWLKEPVVPSLHHRSRHNLNLSLVQPMWSFLTSSFDILKITQFRRSSLRKHRYLRAIQSCNGFRYSREFTPRLSHLINAYW